MQNKVLILLDALSLKKKVEYVLIANVAKHPLHLNHVYYLK